MHITDFLQQFKAT